MIARRDGFADNPLTIDPNLKAQALYELIRDGAASHDARRNGHQGKVSRIPSITLIADVGTFLSGPHGASVSETWAGVPIPPQSLARLACDANISEVLLGLEGEPINVGRASRSVTDGQKRVLRSIYDSCPISGASFTDCEIHHVCFWERGGPTDIENLVPISSRWHHLIHDEGWGLTMNSDRTLRIHRPDGALWKQIEQPPPLVRSHADESDRIPTAA